MGAFILALFCGPQVVAASMLVLSVGDSSSHVIGKKFGRIKHPLSNSKNIEGNLAGGLLGGLGASLFIHPPIALASAFIAMFVEGIELGEEKDQLMEDNIVIPIVSGIIIVLLKGITF